MTKIGIDYLRSNEKRGFDLTTSFGLCALAAVPSVAVAGALCIEASRLNPFFVHERHGGNKGMFIPYKFQTLPPTDDGEPLTTQGTFDSRATTLAQIVRQYGLDELPQLMNVIQGMMSLVGPRPLVAEDLERYRSYDPVLFDEWFSIYEQIKTGIVGDSQLYSHHFKGTNKEVGTGVMKIDLQYFATASLARDIRIVATTPKRLIRANIGIIDIRDSQT